MDIDPRHLRILLAIAEQGSFTRAAVAQRISQPAMSSAIALLEKQLGVRVLERGRHGARLNEFGQLLIRHARGLHALLDQAKAEIDRKRLGYEGPLKIGGTPVTLIEPEWTRLPTSGASTLIPAESMPSMTMDPEWVIVPVNGSSPVTRMP